MVAPGNLEKGCQAASAPILVLERCLQSITVARRVPAYYCATVRVSVVLCTSGELYCNTRHCCARPCLWQKFASQGALPERLRVSRTLVQCMLAPLDFEVVDCYDRHAAVKTPVHTAQSTRGTRRADVQLDDEASHRLPGRALTVLLVFL
jgi:hypothetical protein